MKVLNIIFWPKNFHLLKKIPKIMVLKFKLFPPFLSRAGIVIKAKMTTNSPAVVLRLFSKQ